MLLDVPLWIERVARTVTELPADHDIVHQGALPRRLHLWVIVEITLSLKDRVRIATLAPAMAGALQAAWAIAETIKSGKPLDIQITASQTGLDIAGIVRPGPEA